MKTRATSASLSAMFQFMMKSQTRPDPSDWSALLSCAREDIVVVIIIVVVGVCVVVVVIIIVDASVGVVVVVRARTRIAHLQSERPARSL
jgi:hypothetical protein